MKFGGNKYAYISSKKVEVLNEKKKQEKNLETISENKESYSRGRSSKKNEEELKEKGRSRSRSIESVNSAELDKEYSDDEIEEEVVNQNPSSSSGGFLNTIKNIFTSSSSSKPQMQPLNNVNIQPIKKEKRVKEVKYDLHKGGRKNEVYHHEVDTNVLTFQFNFLKEKVDFATGDPYYCGTCNVVFNKFSKIEEVEKEGNKKLIWTCEFCNAQTELQIEKEEIPTKECVDYFVQSVSSIKTDMKFSDEKTVIYCFDTSGSMCVSEPLAGKHKIKGEYISKYKNDLMKFSDGSNQHYESNHGQITYISRLQCLQAGIESYINEMSKISPKNKIGIVTFSNEVICYGDGSNKELIKVNGNNLYEYNKIVEAAEKSQHLISKPIGETAGNLVKHLYSIEENGQTALGPGILYSVNLIKNSAPGSKIILCTDGLANIGLGSMDDLAHKDDKNYASQFDKLSAFYSEIGDLAKSRGIIINILTFVGEESKLEILNNLCEKTGGEIIRVKPNEILNEFSNLMENEIVATNVKISIKLHKIMEFRNEDQSLLSKEKNDFTKQIGNATNETELYVEYCAKSTDDILKLGVDIEAIKIVYFQSIINYTNMEGNRCIRVITKSQELCSEKEKVNQQAEFDILNVNAIQQCGKIAKKGEYRQAQSHAMAYKQMLKKNINANDEVKTNYKLFNGQMSSMNSNLQKALYEEEENMINQNLNVMNMNNINNMNNLNNMNNMSNLNSMSSMSMSKPNMNMNINMNMNTMNNNLSNNNNNNNQLNSNKIFGDNVEMKKQMRTQNRQDMMSEQIFSHANINSRKMNKKK